MKKHFLRLFCATALLPFAIAPLKAQTAATTPGWEYSQPQIRLPLMTTAPQIDGEIATDEWRGAARMERMARALPDAPQTFFPQEVSFWVGGSETELFIAMSSETPPGGKLLARVNPLPGDANAPTSADDSLELLLDPLREAKDGRRRVYQAILNAKNAIYDMAFVPGGGAQPWRGHWRIGNKIVGDAARGFRWQIEVAIPWQDLGVAKTDLFQTMGLRIGRNWMQATTLTQSEWSPLGGPYITPETMPLVTFDESAPVVQVLQMQDPQERNLDIQLSIFNSHDKPLQVKATLLTTPQNSPTQTEQKTMTIAPGQTEIVRQTSPTAQIGLNENLRSRLLVTSADNDTIYYRRDFAWQLQRPAIVWTLDAAAAKKVATSFAYFPSFHALKIKTDVSALDNPSQVQGVHALLRRKQNQTLIAQTDLPPLQNGATQMEWKIPALDEGEYQLVVNYKGVTAEPQIFDFVRHKFEWENNTLGKSDILVPPFTPIKVQGKTVETILRRVTMNDLGLWDQVEALNENLLQSPMRLEAQVGGRVLPARGEALRFSTKTPTRVVAQANWKAGPIAGSTQSEWDYDGMMKSTFVLEPAAQTIDSLTLIIPLRDSQMPLLHHVTDASLINYAGSTPKGSGVVWDGSKAARNSIIGNYVPYIWLGGGERGFSVFGENDKGWITDYRKPLQELVRSPDGTLELRLHLISIPSKISASRRIVIGFQATPVKPMNDGWRTHLVNAPRGDYPPRVSREIFLGSCWQWGAELPSQDIYPMNKNFAIYDQLAATRRTGKVDEDFVNKFIATYNLPDKYTAGRFEANLRYGFRAMASQPPSVLVYTDARGVRYDTPEGATFIDEWNVEPFVKRGWDHGSGHSYDNDPVASLRDYKIWYEKKMLNTFADQIYYDVVFLKPNYDTISSDAHALPDGTIQPASGIFNVRGLVRRTAILQAEMHRPSNTMLHMSGTAMAPIMAFAGTHLTWEDKAGDAPFQDRFAQDYVQAESIGRQFGTTPYALPLILGKDEEKNAWAERTGAGILLAHEMKTYGNWAAYWDNYHRLLDFGYGTPEVKVFNYFDANYPAQISGSKTASLLLVKPKEALMIVTDYANGGDIRVQLDATALGLKGALTATDMETGEQLQVQQNSILFPLKKYDFRALRITEK
jgi:hypothetical protein